MVLPPRKLKAVYREIGALKPYHQNARTHSPKQIRQIAKSIEQFGFNNPILIDEKNGIVAGHGRLEAAKLLKLTEVPTIQLSHLTPELARAYMLADNRIAEESGWDKGILTIEFQGLADLDLGFDLDTTGFEMAEIDLLIDGEEADTSDPADEVPELEEKAITQFGDIWQLGENRLLCADALEAESYQALMQDEKADMVFTDPPYNVAIDKHVCGNGKIKHREFAMASGEMSESQFVDFLHTSCSNLRDYSRDGSLHYICMDWRHIYELLQAAKPVYHSLHNICVWNKDNGGMGSMYRSKHEFVVVFKHGNEPHLNNIELGKHGRYRTNVWDYAGVNSFAGNQSDLAMHPTVKPVRMVADAIKDCTKRGQLVLDPFAGSGTTLIAAEKSGRIARCIELDPLYCDTIIRRWQDYTGQEVAHVNSDKTFNQLNEMEADNE
ncbi:MAG: DNA methyltransferase [Rickettsiales bacterium]|nr:DNA methyltransferase [Rickettsiales bacterium]